MPVTRGPLDSAAFWREHVLANRPIVLRGLAGSEGLPPLSQLCDFDHLRRRCGHRRVCVKSLAVDDAEGRADAFALGETQTLESQFAELQASEAVEAELEQLKNRLTHQKQED